MNTKNVPVGISSKVGFIAAAAAAVAPIIGEIADAAEPLGVPPAVWVVVSAVLACVTVLGRMWQAAASAGVTAPVATGAEHQVEDVDVMAPEGLV